MSALSVYYQPNSGDIDKIVPAGTVIYVSQNSAPDGYLKANGAAVSRSAYAVLFATIGTIFGAGNGTTTFNLPDLRGEFIRGFDDNRGVDSGRGFGNAQGHAFESHNHMQSSSGGTLAGGSSWFNLASGGGFGGVLFTNNTGGTETRPRNMALLACIKT
jgi:phage-related tail fiber protein